MEMSQDCSQTQFVNFDKTRLMLEGTAIDHSEETTMDRGQNLAMIENDDTMMDQREELGTQINTLESPKM